MSAALAIRGLSKRFGGLQAIRDLSFDVAPGEVLGLIGPNGAGKTTAFDLISGFLVADEGDVVFVIENGRITIEGSGADLLRSPHITQAYLGV